MGWAGIGAENRAREDLYSAPCTHNVPNIPTPMCRWIFACGVFRLIGTRKSTAFFFCKSRKISATLGHISPTYTGRTCSEVVLVIDDDLTRGRVTKRRCPLQWWVFRRTEVKASCRRRTSDVCFTSLVFTLCLSNNNVPDLFWLCQSVISISAAGQKLTPCLL